MKLFSTIFILLFFSVVLSKQFQKNKSTARFIRYQKWNTKMYPVWKNGDPRYTSSWTGGELKFDVRNDAPTLTGANVTFTIDIILPDNQLVLPNEEVVWRKNCFVNGIQRHEGEPVYPQESIDKQDAVFPDGSLLHKHGAQKSPYVFVWKTCGKYWQVSDGLSSSLTISTEGIHLGSYVMDVVIYHHRKRDKFIPIGYASTQFCVTDQIPFAVTLTQVNDEDERDQTFIQNRAIAFSIAIHDPSSYLVNSDITFNWDFGDGSGTVISRELTLTHTYTKTGFFKPHVVVQASIPNPSCRTPPNTTPVTNPTADAFVSEKRAGPVQLISTESASKDMEQSGSFSDDLKTAPHLVTDGVTDLKTTYQDTTVFKNPQPPNFEQDCVVYRYGSFSTRITVVESVEDMQMVQAVSAFREQNTVDFTISCQQSLSADMCTVISKCLSQSKTICSVISSLPECQLPLRHLFNHSGNFCINVSVTNDVSVSVSSTKINVLTGSRFIIIGTLAMVLGIMAVALAIWIFTYKHLNLYQPLSEISAAGITYSILLCGLIKQKAAPKHSVLLHRAA
ncbi:premelanosome protein b [Tachysurus vachellii]|uniref:premelanosome protein b n=1 Tax=Tachysurus vachellii TaxID=175792 RepID=UPI00296B1866|nr:premelanosome protein b [Tachysurus vachellii]